jgi:diguanylate cyclase (GGDEF)-like protein
MRVLVVHRSRDVRERMADWLGDAGHEVVAAPDAERAAVRLRRFRPDVLVAPAALCEPGNGDLLDAVKSDATAFHTAVVPIAPAGIRRDETAELLRRGADDVLLEPVRGAEVVARVHAAGRTKTLQEELVAQARRMEGRVFEDALTGIYNRRFLFTALEALVSGARRHGRALAVVLVDLDRFKAINDEHGHAAGDRVLAATAKALRDALRAEDVIGRLGGEEFMALLPDTDDAAAAATAERLRAAVVAAEGPVDVTASLGWAVLVPDEDGDAFVRRADEALYAAKSAGRDCVRGPATLPRRS